MESLIIYLLKSAGLLSLFLLAYMAFLKNDTQFNNNRLFLLAGIIISFSLPLLEITRTVIREISIPVTSFELPNGTKISSEVATTAFTPDWWQVAGIIYLTGFAFFLLRFLWQLICLLKFLSSGKHIPSGGYTYVHSDRNLQPFSFFRYIVLNPAAHEAGILEIILQHERVHARQWHSLDILLSNFAAILLWFNPLVFIYRKKVEQNLEFIADKETVAAAIPVKKYQKTLIGISVRDFQPALTNQFYQSFIKKRIIMLNKNSTRNNFWKTGIILPFLIVFTMLFQIKTEAQVVTKGEAPDVTFQSDVKISSTISKNSQDESLERLKKIFKRQDVDLSFENVKRSPEGIITSMDVSFRNTKTGETGKLSRNNPEGIESFSIFTEKGNTGIKEVSNTSTLTGHDASILRVIGVNPLYIIGTKEYTSSELQDKFIHVLGEVTALPTEDGIAKYGQKAKDGVLIISEGIVGDDIQAEMKRIDMEGEKVFRHFIQITKDQKPTLMTVDNNPGAGTKSGDKENINKSFTIEGKSDAIVFRNTWQKSKMDSLGTNASQFRNASYAYYTGDEQPLYIINGKEKEDFDLKSVEHENIKSMNVLNSESGKAKYGEKGRNGVIEISLKTGSEKEEAKQDEKITYTARTVTVESFRDDEKPASGKGNKNTKVTIAGIEDAEFISSGQLFVVDDKVMDEDFDPTSIDHTKIETFVVLKGDLATKKYGEKASEGAIEITTKKE